MTQSHGMEVPESAGYLSHFLQKGNNMNFEDFNKLSDEEKKAFFETTVKDQEKKISDLTAERDSLKKEVEENRIMIEEGKKDLAATKELNYTLARKVNLEKDKKSFEETLHEAFSGGNKK